MPGHFQDRAWHTAGLMSRIAVPRHNSAAVSVLLAPCICTTGSELQVAESGILIFEYRQTHRITFVLTAYSICSLLPFITNISTPYDTVTDTWRFDQNPVKHLKSLSEIVFKVFSLMTWITCMDFVLKSNITISCLLDTITIFSKKILKATKVMVREYLSFVVIQIVLQHKIDIIVLDLSLKVISWYIFLFKNTLNVPNCRSF